MKKLLLSALCLVTGLCSHAQVSVGLKGGINAARFHYKPKYKHNNANYAPYAGIAATIPLSPKLLLQPELLVSVKGQQVRYYSYPYPGSLNTSDYLDEKKNLNYISFPLLATYRATSRLAVSAGPELSYLLSTGYRPKRNANYSGEEITNLDLAAVAGASYQLGRLVGIEVRYTQGFIEVIKPNYSGGEDFGTNRVLQAGLIFTLPKMKESR